MPSLTGDEVIRMASVVVLTRNRKEKLRQCIKSIRSQDFPSVEIIVVDNDSDDGTTRMMRDDFEGVNYVKLDENRGVGARNVGVEKADGELIFTLDDDSEFIRPNTITRVVEKFRQNSDLGAAGFRIIDEAGNEENWFKWEKAGSEKQGYLSPSFLPCGAAVRPEMFERTGGFWEPYFIYVEERDLATRILNSGAEIRFFPLISIRHHRDNRNRETSRLFYYVTRNSLWYFWRNFGMWRALKKSLFYVLSQATRVPFEQDGLIYYLQALAHAISGFREAYRTRKPVKSRYRPLVEGKVETYVSSESG